MHRISSDIIQELVEKYLTESSNTVKKLNTIIHKSKNYQLDEFIIENEEMANYYDKPIGIYKLLTIIQPTEITDAIKKIYIKIIKDIISSFIIDLKPSDNVLIVGLGNEEIESDSLGHLVAKNILVTRHLKNNSEFKDTPAVSAITPSVMGMTGIESSDIIKSIVKEIKPKYVIVIDSLCASSISRLGKSIQITNGGIFPGAGVNNKRKPLNQSTLGTQVIAIGVPLMIFAKTLCENTKNIDENFVVTFNNIGEIVNIISELIYKAINLSLVGFESI